VNHCRKRSAAHSLKALVSCAVAGFLMGGGVLLIAAVLR